MLASDDRVNWFVHAHHAAPRVGEPQRYDPHNPAARDEEGAGEVRELVAGLLARLDPKREDKLKRSREEVVELEQVRMSASLRRRGFGSHAEAYKQEQRRKREQVAGF